MASFLIRGADLIDGSGAPRVAADVRVSGDRIEAVLAPGADRSTPAVDADGLVLCPGFIDTHTHDDTLVLRPTVPHPKLVQGVATVVTGNCGLSIAPLGAQRPPPLDELGGEDLRLPDFRSYAALLDAMAPALNVVPLVGHTSLRLKHVKALDRTATGAEIAAMRQELAGALADGAFGLSTGVYYPPARAAGTNELIGVASALRTRPGAPLAMHLRDEADGIDAAIVEALRVGAACGATLVLSHHKVVGVRNHGRTRHTLRTIAAASRHQAVCLDCYPYTASSTTLDPDRVAGGERVLVTWSAPHPRQQGRLLRDIAAEWRVDVREAALRLLPAGAIYFVMADEDVERVLAHPLTMIGSDGLPHDAHPHPRLWGSFPRVLGHYSRDRGLLPLETAVHKMTGLPAQRFGLADRGRVAAGCAADLVLFDPARIRDVASYEQPTARPEGLHALWINGQLVMRDGELRELRAGRRLRPPAQPVRRP